MKKIIGKIKGLKTAHLWVVSLVKKPGQPHPTPASSALCGEEMDERGIVEVKKVTCKTCQKIAKS
jgi:hypothetical protein